MPQNSELVSNPMFSMICDILNMKSSRVGSSCPEKTGPLWCYLELQSLIRVLQREHTRLYAHWNARCSPYDNDVDSEVTSHVTERCSSCGNDVSLRAKNLAPSILLPTCLLLGVFGRGGERSCHCNFILTSDHTVGPGNTLALVPNGLTYPRML